MPPSSKETSATIAAWALSAFGSVKNIERLVARAEQELIELRDALREKKEAEEIIEEAADVAILLHRLVALLGSDLDVAVTQKMIRNRQRQWILAGDGTGQHKT